MSPFSTAAASPGSSGGSWGPVRRAARPDAGRDCDAACDVAPGDAQPLPQQFGDDGASGQVGVVGPVGWFDEFAEYAVHLAAVDPVLAFETFGDLDAKRIADRVGAGRAQLGVTGVDRIECGADLLLLLRLHAFEVIRTYVR